MIFNFDSELDNQELLKNLPIEERRLSFLLPYINDLESLGLVFDFSLVDKSKRYVAIDCDSSIKFIPEREYRKELKITDYLKSKIVNCKTSQAEDFVNNQLKKELFKVNSSRLNSKILNTHFNAKVDHCIDYLNDFPKEKNRIKRRFHEDKQQEQFLLLEREIKSLEKLNFLQMIEKSNIWMEKLNKRASIVENDNDVEIVYEEDNFLIVKLLTEQSYQREGKLMGHCVASYYDYKYEIYSLRDKKNIPHVTMCVGRNRVQEVKGKNNGSIKKEYAQVIVNFINRTDRWITGRDIYLDMLTEHVRCFRILDNFILVMAEEHLCDSHKYSLSKEDILYKNIDDYHKRINLLDRKYNIGERVSQIISKHFLPLNNIMVPVCKKEEYEKWISLKEIYPYWEDYYNIHINSSSFIEILNKDLIYDFKRYYLNHFSKWDLSNPKKYSRKEISEKIFKIKLIHEKLNMFFSHDLYLEFYYGVKSCNNPYMESSRNLSYKVLSMNNRVQNLCKHFSLFCERKGFDEKFQMINHKNQENSFHSRGPFDAKSCLHNLIVAMNKYLTRIDSFFTIYATDICSEKEMGLIPKESFIKENHFDLDFVYEALLHCLVSINNSIDRLLVMNQEGYYDNRYKELVEEVLFYFKEEKVQEDLGKFAWDFIIDDGAKIFDYYDIFENIHKNYIGYKD